MELLEQPPLPANAPGHGPTSRALILLNSFDMVTINPPFWSFQWVQEPLVCQRNGDIVRVPPAQPTPHLAPRSTLGIPSPFIIPDKFGP